MFTLLRGSVVCFLPLLQERSPFSFSLDYRVWVCASEFANGVLVCQIMEILQNALKNQNIKIGSQLLLHQQGQIIRFCWLDFYLLYVHGGLVSDRCWNMYIGGGQCFACEAWDEQGSTGYIANKGSRLIRGNWQFRYLQDVSIPEITAEQSLPSYLNKEICSRNQSVHSSIILEDALESSDSCLS